MASVMQVLFKIPEIADRYYGHMDEIFRNEREPADNFHVQMAKLGHGLLSGKYSQVTEEEKENKKLCSVCSNNINMECDYIYIYIFLDQTFHV